MYFMEVRLILSIGVLDIFIEIVVLGLGVEYIDLKRSWLYVKVRIFKVDGIVLVINEKIGIVNLLL